MENKFLTLEQTIRRLGKAKSDQPLEKDMNDQIHIGGYTSKNFEVSRKAQELFASLPKDADVDAMERSANLHDLLFGIHKKVFASDRSSAQDVESAEELEKKIMSLAKQAGLESKHDHVGKSIAFIRSKYDAKGNVFPGVSPQEVEKRFTSPPKDYQSEVSSDNDIDNVKDFIISRNKRAQRKLKIIDDEYKPGEKQMSNLDKIRAAFLEGYKNKKETKTVEEASGTKSQVARIIDTAKTAKDTLKDQPNNPEAQRVMRQSLGKIKAQLDARKKERLDRATAAKKKSLGLDENENVSTLGEESCKNCQCSKCKKKQKVYEHVIELTERRAPRRGISRKQFMITVSKGQFRKRIRNDPKIIVAHQKQGWAVVGGAEKFNPKKD